MIADDRRLWMVGCGNMGGAMLARWLETGTLAYEQVMVIDPHAHAVPDGVARAEALPDEAGDIVLLAVKPGMLDAVAPALARRPPRLLVSILAGTPIATLRTATGAGRVVRAMPNLPVATGRGVVALAGDADDARPLVDTLMAPMGLVEWVDEGLLHAVTALSGSGPAFVYRFVDALAAAGVTEGLAPDAALRLAIATVEGAAALAGAADVDPATLAERVASPGGTTRAGLDVLDAEGTFAGRVVATIQAAAARSRALAG